MNLYRYKYGGEIYRILSRKCGITLCRFFDSKREHWCKDFKELKQYYEKIPAKKAKQIIASKYIHKKSGNVYRVRNYAICKDRDVEVVIYTDSEGKCYTREKSEFLEKFANEPKG